MKTLPYIVFCFLMLCALSSSINSYRRTEYMIAQDVNQALEQVLAKMPDNVVTTDTIRCYRNCITIAELRSIKRPVTNLYRYAGKGNNAREDYERLTDQVEEVAKMNYPSPYFDWRTEWNKRAEGLAKNWRKR